jgi:hypothetical protein
MTPIAKVADTIHKAASGMSLAQLQALHAKVPRRTLQRWLAALVAEKIIQPVGQGRTRRYTKATAATATLDATALSTSSTNLVMTSSGSRVSADSQDIINYLAQPMGARNPVGYQRDFIETYIPNSTYYLSPSLRRQLHAIGSTEQAAAPAGTHSRAVLNRLLIDLSWASSHLEGNTYSRLDTRELIEFGRAAEGKPAIETQMILNHKSAIELLVENIESVEFNRYTIMNLHSVLSENLLPNPADEGRLRRHAVDITHSVYKPISNPQQLEDLFDVLLSRVNQITDPFEQAFFIMVHLPYLQPFADINKRVSRLAANLPLFRANLCPMTFIGVPPEMYSRAILGVYELTRVELLRDVFVWAYERSTQEYIAIKQTLAQPDPERLRWRALIKSTIREIVLTPEMDAMVVIEKSLKSSVAEDQRANVAAIIIEDLRRIHEGVLARYGLRLSSYLAWKTRQIH